MNLVVVSESDQFSVSVVASDRHSSIATNSEFDYNGVEQNLITIQAQDNSGEP